MPRWLEIAQLVSLLFHPNKTRPHAIYDLLSTHNNLGSQTLYLNLGYWKDATTYDEACAALALLAATSIEVGAGDEVLDAGFGFADQDMLWMERLRPRKITGINVTPSQVAIATDRVQKAGFAGEIALIEASATAMPFVDASFDKLVSVEAAFHFVTRERFFAEALRVLRPGGRIALADVIPSVRRKKRPRPLQWLVDLFGRALWQFPSANLYDSTVYAEKMKAAGFVDVVVRDISADVFLPFKKFARERVKSAEIKARVNPLLRNIWGTGEKRYSGPHPELDYVIITAARPK